MADLRKLARQFKKLLTDNDFCGLEFKCVELSGPMDKDLPVLKRLKILRSKRIRIRQKVLHDFLACLKIKFKSMMYNIH
jgi:hypothetical protein